MLSQLNSKNILPSSLLSIRQKNVTEKIPMLKNLGSGYITKWVEHTEYQ